jgi:DNA excision repair protein ERCC-4
MKQACRPRIYVDIREKGSGVPEALARLGVAVIYEQLGVGDYVVSDRVVVERKTVPDLAESLFDGRLFDQVRRMREYYEIPVVIVEGEIGELGRITGRATQVLQALAALSIDYGVRVLWSRGVGDTAALLYTLSCREREAGRPVVLNRKPRLDKLWMQQLYVVQSLPGVGPRLAERLLEKMGSIAAICRASIVELERVLGAERARRVYRILHAPYSPPRRSET